MKYIDKAAQNVLRKGLGKEVLSSFIARLPLGEACVAFGLMHLQTPSTLQGQDFGQLAKRLIDAEVQPGGPYKNSRGVPDITTNTCVAFLAATMKKELPAVTRFLAENSIHMPSAITLSPATIQQTASLLGNNANQTQEFHAMRDHILRNARTILTTLDTTTQTVGAPLLDRIIHADKRGEIILFADSYNRSIHAPVNDATIVQLGTANLFCWMAYTLYDDIQDDSQNTHLVSLANLCHRQSIALYQKAAGDNPGTAALIHRSFDMMDSANIWEVTYCRNLAAPPTYKSRHILAQRSLGHILGPLIIARNTAMSAKMRSSLKAGLVHYLIARQLSDDIHDWRDDAAKSHASYVVCCLLRRTMDGSSMETAFWKSEAIYLSELVIQHTQKARDFFVRADIPKHTPFFDYVTQLEKSAQKAIQRQYSYQRFLDAYRQTLA